MNPFVMEVRTIGSERTHVIVDTRTGIAHLRENDPLKAKKTAQLLNAFDREHRRATS